MLSSSSLKQFTGTTRYYRHWLRRFVYTQGIDYVAETGSAYWLLDAIPPSRDALRFASYQPELLKDPLLQQFQHWKLTVHPDQTATLVCERDTSDVVVTQEIVYTNFALSSLRLYLVQGVLMLPSEY